MPQTLCNSYRVNMLDYLLINSQFLISPTTNWAILNDLPSWPSIASIKYLVLPPLLTTHPISFGQVQALNTRKPFLSKNLLPLFWHGNKNIMNSLGHNFITPSLQNVPAIRPWPRGNGSPVYIRRKREETNLWERRRRQTRDKDNFDEVIVWSDKRGGLMVGAPILWKPFVQNLLFAHFPAFPMSFWLRLVHFLNDFVACRSSHRRLLFSHSILGGRMENSLRHSERSRVYL